MKVAQTQKFPRRFAISGQDEPHVRHHLEVLQRHPEIRSLNGYDLRTTFVGFALVALQLVIAGAVQNRAAQLNTAAHWLAFGLLCYGIGAVLSHWCGMTIHETSHNLAARQTWQNQLVALLANVPMVVPIAASFRRYHLTHHVLLGVDGEDNDLPLSTELKFIGRSRLLKFFWLSSYFFVYMARGKSFAKNISRAEWFNGLTQALAVFAICHWMGGTALLYLSVSTVLGYSLHPVAAHFIHEHYTFAEGQETYSYYGPLNWVTFNVGYHYEHHDFMDVPGWRLPELHRIARDFYGPLRSHRSWTWVLWHFISSRKMGPDSRIVRPRATHDQARRELRASLRRSEWPVLGLRSSQAETDVPARA